MNIIVRDIPTSAYTLAPPSGRPHLGVGFHHTATAFTPFPRREGSWHFCITREADLLIDVPWQHIAHHIGQTDKWRPPWVVAGPGTTSDINWCTWGCEVQYAPQEGQTPTVAQHVTARYLLEEWLPANTGVDPATLYAVGHGQVDSSKWPTEPHGWSWPTAGWRWTPAGYRYVGVALPDPPPDEGEEEMPLPQPVLDPAHLVAVQAAIWGPEAWDPAGADFGIQTAWRQALQAGYDMGAPTGPEQPLDDGSVFRRFERGTLFWHPQNGGSWVG